MFQSDEDGASFYTEDVWVLRKYIEQFRWAQINKIGMECNGISLVKWNNVVLADGVTYPSLEFQMLSRGKYDIYPWYDDRIGHSRINYSNGLAEIRFFHDGNKVLIRVTEERADDLIEYLYCSESDYVSQLNNYAFSIGGDATDNYSELASVIPVDGRKLLTGTNIAKTILSLITKKPAAYNDLCCDYLTCATSEIQKTELLGFIKNVPCNVRSIYKSLNADRQKDFVVNLALIYKEIDKPAVNEVDIEYFDYDGEVYTKLLSWEDTFGPDDVYISRLGSGDCDITVFSKWWDWTDFSYTNDYLMTLSPFEYVGLSTVNAYSYLGGDFIPGESIVIMPGFMLDWILTSKEHEDAIEGIITIADIGLTIYTGGSYAIGKSLAVVGSKMAVSMAIDAICQAAIISLDPENDFTTIDLTEIAWSGANSIISNPATSTTISVIRTAVLAAFESEGDFEESVLSALESGVDQFIISIITNSTVGNSHYLKLLESVFEKSPRAVYDKLIQLNISPELIQTISESFVNSELRELIRSYDDK